MTAPRSAIGAKIADRAPTAIRRSPRCSARHASSRSPSESALCSTATLSPNAARNRSTVCGVRAISGTSTIAPFPCTFTTWRSTSMYTSVLPLPVMPCRSATSPGAAAMSVSIAARCAADGSSGAAPAAEAAARCASARAANGSRITACFVIISAPRFARAVITARVIPSFPVRCESATRPSIASSASYAERWAGARLKKTSRSRSDGKRRMTLTVASSRPAGAERLATPSALGSIARYTSPTGVAYRSAIQRPSSSSGAVRAGTASGASRIAFAVIPSGNDASSAVTMPTSRPLRSGTTTRAPGTTRAASASGTAYVNGTKSGTGSATAARRGPLMRASAA